ncbi:unnamed protein product [Protopolystoma xenopodis]|uniref:Uncharacterized protein n=1 Tax=Protopolystoma xenopodis TaxID=117903 RepID=A0A448XSE6_9PLAT|nr:unnamed protein product [Protopolystoma xenopodis]
MRETRLTVGCSFHDQLNPWAHTDVGCIVQKSVPTAFASFIGCMSVCMHVYVCVRAHGYRDVGGSDESSAEAGDRDWPTGRHSWVQRRKEARPARKRDEAELGLRGQPDNAGAVACSSDDTADVEPRAPGFGFPASGFGLRASGRVVREAHTKQCDARLDGMATVVPCVGWSSCFDEGRSDGVGVAVTTSVPPRSVGGCVRPRRDKRTGWLEDGARRGVSGGSRGHQPTRLNRGGTCDGAKASASLNPIGADWARPTNGSRAGTSTSRDQAAGVGETEQSGQSNPPTQLVTSSSHSIASTSLRRLDNVYKSSLRRLYNVSTSFLQRLLVVSTTSIRRLYNVYTSKRRFYNVYTSFLQRLYVVSTTSIRRLYNVYTSFLQRLYVVSTTSVRRL